MRRTLLLTSLLLVGLFLSQAIPATFGAPPSWFLLGTQFLTMSLLSFIMIEVGREFEIDLKRKRQYAVDYGVAATAAAFPWIPEQSSSGRPLWMEALLAGRFAAPNLVLTGLFIYFVNKLLTSAERDIAREAGLGVAA